MLPPLLDKACQKLQGIQDVPSQRVIDLEAAIRQLRQLSCILDKISPVTKLARRRKPYCFCHIQPKGQARHRRTQCRYHHAQMMSTIFQLMKTIGKSTSVSESTANLAALQRAGLGAMPSSKHLSPVQEILKSMMIGKALSGL